MMKKSERRTQCSKQPDLKDLNVPKKPCGEQNNWNTGYEIRNNDVYEEAFKKYE